MTAMAGEDAPFMEKLSSLQQSMHATEKRRLELERELFTYSKSDKRILQIKCSKLRSYHQQICDREARAKMRNLELLKEAENLEISMRGYRPDLGPLKERKAEYFKKISRYTEERKESARNIRKDKSAHGSGSSSHLKPQAPSNIFLDQESSRGSNTKSEHSHQVFSRSPNRSVHSAERLPSGLLKDSGVGGEEAAGSRAHLSDDISGSNDSPDGGNLSDTHERTSPDVAAVRGTPAGTPFEGDDEGGALSPLTLTRPLRNPSPGSGGVSGPTRMENPPEGKNDSTVETSEADVHQGTSEQHKGVTLPRSEPPLSDSSDSDLSLSLTQSEPEEDSDEDSAPEDGTPPSDERPPRPPPPEAALQPGPKTGAETESVSQEGLFYLLDFIEGRLGVERRLYRDSSVDEKRLVRIIRRCEGRGVMDDEDLEACGAVVLHQIRSLSRGVESGCLLPPEIVSAHLSCTEAEQISSSLPPDAARLWDRWFKHALLLKEHRILGAEDLVQLFTPVLLRSDATHVHQAKVLLRTLLSRSSEECPSAEESELSSSRDPHSLQARREGVKPRENIQDLQSSEEDSQDESPVESVPIRETKAYQLLKQSAMQERPRSPEGSEEEDSPTGINRGREVDLGWARRSSHQDPYPGKEKTQKEGYSVLQSKAFWGETDDSGSEIEAALRPEPLHGESDDDFYD